MSVSPTTPVRAVHGRRAPLPRPGLIRVWMAQPPHVWQELLAKGELLADPEYVYGTGLTEEAVGLVLKHMAGRIRGYGGGLPWWGYPGRKPRNRRWVRHMVDLGYLGCIGLDLARDLLLPHDHEYLVAVSNRHYLALSRGENRRFERELTRAGIDLLSRPYPEPWQSQVEASWEHAFDLELLAMSEWGIADPAVCFERLRLEDVVWVEELRAERPPDGESQE